MPVIFEASEPIGCANWRVDAGSESNVRIIAWGAVSPADTAAPFCSPRSVSNQLIEGRGELRSSLASGVVSRRAVSTSGSASTRRTSAATEPPRRASGHAGAPRAGWRGHSKSEILERTTGDDAAQLVQFFAGPDFQAPL